jgi:hypothetical protein
MWADKVGLAFFLARLFDVSAGRALFIVVAEIVLLLFSCWLLLVVFAQMLLVAPMGPLDASTVGAAPGSSCPAHEISGNECVVLSVRCL